MTIRFFLAVALAAVATPHAAEAELCMRPDGTYTDQCSERDHKVPGGPVSRAASPEPDVPEAASTPPAAPAPGPTAEDERYWRGRLREAQKRLQVAETHLSDVQNHDRECRRIQFDPDREACEQNQLAEAQRRVDEAREYISSGLEDECRRSSRCQTSWIQ